ncbi:hypothetical protein Jiend_27490 [Micromonospora endophytica]|nr:hypothetical protein [Micromonospora endophytica]BCJ59327.1 hypothetical protein Jiend_27490 [Micromonospora endophytica]
MTISPQLWFALYTDATAFSLWLYLYNRRYNVSPYEPAGSRGLKGMLMSIISAPIYAGQLISTLLRRPAKFVVTPKGASSSSDGLRTFRAHLGWLVVLVAAIAVAFVRDYASPAALLWPVVAVLICLAPIVLWRRDLGRTAAKLAEQAGAIPEVRSPDRVGDITMEIPRVLREAHEATRSTREGPREIPAAQPGDWSGRIPTQARPPAVERVPKQAVDPDATELLPRVPERGQRSGRFGPPE